MVVGLMGGLCLMVFSLVTLILKSCYLGYPIKVVTLRHMRISHKAHVLSVLIEELIYRALPIYTYYWLFSDWGIPALSIVIILSSMWFVYSHRRKGFITNIDIGVGGIFLSIIFVNGGFLASFLAHLLRNYSLDAYTPFIRPKLARFLRSSYNPF